MAGRTVGLVAPIASGTGLVLGRGSTGTITASVTDVSGAVLQGAAITVKQVETGLTRAAQTDASGNFTIPSLPVSAHEVTAEKMGFRREVRQGIDLLVENRCAVGSKWVDIFNGRNARELILRCMFLVERRSHESVEEHSRQ